MQGEREVSSKNKLKPISSCWRIYKKRLSKSQELNLEIALNRQQYHNKDYTKFCGSSRKRIGSFWWGIVGVPKLKTQLQALLVVSVQVPNIKICDFELYIFIKFFNFLCGFCCFSFIFHNFSFLVIKLLFFFFFKLIIY